jgi:DNA-binding PadR family transcriptional regulator
MVMGVAMQTNINNLISELRRGTLVLSVLSQLKNKQYGYSLREKLAEKGFNIDQGTLYPLLRRLEEQGLLDSEWSITTSRPRRYYVLNSTGEEVLDALTQEWRSLVSSMEQVLQTIQKTQS